MKPSAFILFFLSISLSTFSQDLDSIFRIVKYRNIGPFRGGRSVTASGVIHDPPSIPNQEEINRLLIIG